MKNYEEIIGEACRIEYVENEGRLFIVFEITEEKHKQDIKRNWYRDIEYRIVDRKLVRNTEGE
jgi:hypothetical protein